TFILNDPHPPKPAIFPYTTLFRSKTSPAPADHAARIAGVWQARPAVRATAPRDGLATPEGRSTRESCRASEPAASALSPAPDARSEEHTSELQSRENLVCRLLLEK